MADPLIRQIIRLVCYVMVFGLLPGVAAAACHNASTPAGGEPLKARSPRKVIGYLAEWNQEQGLQTIRAHDHMFSEISPFWYTLDSSGSLIPYNADHASPAVVTELHAMNIKVTPTIANIRDGVWHGGLISRIIGDSALRKAHVDAVVHLVETNGYDGIDIDYESLSSRDRAPFSQFIEQLAAALHAKGKTLTVPVYAKTSEPGPGGAHQAQDWAAIGQAADEVRIMIYDYHWATSEPGPIAPWAWADQVAAFSISKIPRQKIILGFGLYGYDWSSGKAATLIWQESIGRARDAGTNIQWDAESMAPWFKYVDARKVGHTVWFENGRSIDTKLDLINTYDVAGVHFWYLGGEDTQTWQAVESKLGDQMSSTTTRRAYIPFLHR